MGTRLPVALLAEGVDRNSWYSVPSTSVSVALLAEGVDRNLGLRWSESQPPVALLAEGVDRNMAVDYVTGLVVAVALLAEGVDRNFQTLAECDAEIGSPSSRRAWIEISGCQPVFFLMFVALLAEGVDRNLQGVVLGGGIQVALLAEGVDRNNLNLNNPRSNSKSSSSRRAWIEIASACTGCTAAQSPSSRRAWIEMACWAAHLSPLWCRPPHGGRG